MSVLLLVSSSLTMALDSPLTVKINQAFTNTSAPFGIDFADDTQSTYSLGQDLSIQLVAQGDAGDKPTVIVSAWDKGASRIVTHFTTVLEGEPWVIPASRMNQLPEGEVVITLEPIGGEKVSRVFTVQPEKFRLTFEQDAPSTVTAGTHAPVQLVPQGDPGNDPIVIVSAWDKQRSQIVPQFTLVLRGEPWTIPGERMGMLPPGQMVLTTEPLGGLKVHKAITVLSDEAPDEEPVTPPLSGNEEEPVTPPPGGNDEEPVVSPPPQGEIGQGFTDYKTSSDSKIVYVPSGGSIKSGYDQLRHGYPDHLLLQAGGTYNLGSGLKWAKSGRSKEQPMVFGVAGDGDRPVIHCSGAAISFSGTVQHTAFVGLHLTADTRNPGHPSYRSDVGRYDGFSLFSPAINLTIEDCVIEYFTHGIMLEGANDVNVRIHRSIIRHSWSNWSQGHSQGLYAYRTNGLTITDSVFDQNGWEPRASGGGRTIFNHNIYVIGIKNMVIQNSIFTRGSSNGMNIRTGFTNAEALSNVTVRGNILIDNANAIGVGNKTPDVVSDGLLIENNVICRQGTVLNNAAQSMGIGVTSFRNIDVNSNYFIDKPFGGTSFAVKLESSTYNGKVYGNVVHNWALSESAVQTKGSSTSASGNYVNQSDSTYADASRTLDSYLKSVGASGGTSGFIQWVNSRRRGTWDTRPCDLVKYIEAGFKPRF